MGTLSNAFKKSVLGPIDLYDCSNRMTIALGPRIAQDEKGRLVTDILKSAVEKLNAVTEESKARPQTARIAELDAKRDQLLFMFRDMVKANKHNIMNPGVQKAALEVGRLYADLIGNLTRMGVIEEGKAVRYLLNALADTEFAQYVTALGIESLVAELARVQGAIEALYAQRSASNTAPGSRTVKTHMVSTADALRRFLGYLDVVIAENIPASADIGETAHTIIAEVEAIARSRKTRTQNSAAVEPEPEFKKAA